MESVIKNTIIGELGPLISLPMTVASTITAPGYFYFFENSKGPVGQREWSFESNIFSEISSPKLFIDSLIFFSSCLPIKVDIRFPFLSKRLT